MNATLTIYVYAYGCNMITLLSGAHYSLLAVKSMDGGRSWVWLSTVASHLTKVAVGDIDIFTPP